MRNARDPHVVHRMSTHLVRQTCTDPNLVCYNSVTEHGQMFCVAVPAGGFGAVWFTVHLLSI